MKTPAFVVMCVMGLTMTACGTAQRTDLVTLRGEPVTLAGAGPEAGEAAPDFVAVGQDMKEKRLSDWRGKTVILSVVPSLDTNTCSLQTKRFNEEAAAIGDGVAIVTLSMDLPFAQKRWCGAEGVERVTTLSDYKHHDFADRYGLRIEENGLLARSVFVIDPSGKVVWKQIVGELTEEPDYEAALIAARRSATGA